VIFYVAIYQICCGCRRLVVWRQYLLNPARRQQLDDHYFRAIPLIINTFMMNFEYEAYKLEIPVRTRHNEVAPDQNATKYKENI
jgi:glutamine synthetase type III